MTLTEDLARFAAEIRFEDLPPRVVRLAKRQILGLLGAAFAGLRAGGVQTIAQAIGKTAAPSSTGNDLARARATALAFREKTSLEDAAYLNACASMAHDMDDYVVFGHTGHSAVFAALGAGEALGRPGKDVLAAIVAANELGGRLGASCLVGPQNGQLWSYVHQLGGAAATARLLGLDARTTRHAISLALAQPTFGLWPAFMGPDSKLTTAAEPLRSGVRAAFLAQAGLTGPGEILDGRTGLLGRIPFVPLPGFLSGLGRAWLTETLSIKTTPGCAYVTAPVVAACEAISALKKSRGKTFDQDEVEKIVVRATFLTVEMDGLSHPYISAVAAGGAGAPVLTPVVVNFSTPLSIAVALLDEGELSPDALAEERLARDQEVILRLSRRVSVEHDTERTALLLHECDRVLDVAALLAGVPLGEIARGVQQQRALHDGSGTASALARAAQVVRGLGSDGRSFARRLVQTRATRAIERVGRAVAHAFEEVIPHGDQDHPPRREKKPLPRYDLGEHPVASFRALFSAHVALHTREGAIFEASCEIPPGAAGRDEAETDKLAGEKLVRHATPVLGEKAARRLESIVLGLEEEKDLAAISETVARGRAIA
ncbi:MmgE/PrpD family protein [bacterium]|nr:MmgE/PrpD family protein [bacterium]